MTSLEIRDTEIPGLLVAKLPLHGDSRGWFKENWQRAKMVAAGLPDFEPVQHSVAANVTRGTTRGIHAEPWDKFVSVAHGRAFGAWVDLRAGESFGTVVTAELDPGTAVFVPRGVGNSYQTLEDDTAYSYLVNDHWSADAVYTHVNAADPSLAIDWPVPLSQAEMSEKDRSHPRLADVTPVAARRTLILGGRGQVGTALQRILPDAYAVDRRALDLADTAAMESWDWKAYDTVINAAAYTQVDAAETPDGRRDAWALNVTAVGRLAKAARDHRLTVVHISTDYVFDGRQETHTEDEPFSPLGVYGQTKAAGDALIAAVARHYIVRTSWVIGEGQNFVRTMAQLAANGVAPSVVDDQRGRLTFADEIARGIAHLLAVRAPYGVYNLTNDGPVTSWADVATDVFEASGKDAGSVRPVSTAEYGADKDMAPRPLNSTLDLHKLRATGFVPRDASSQLHEYLAK